MAESKSDATEKSDLMASLPIATEHERELSQQATHEFNKGNYDGCLSSMNKLVNTRGLDPKVIMNKAVVEFYNSRFSQTDDLKQALDIACTKSHINFANSMVIEDVDHSVVYFNHVVVLYYMRQYRSALKILDRLFQFMEPSADPFSRQMMFILVDLFICTHQPERAMIMIGFLEKTFLNGKSGSPEKESEKKDSSQKESKDSNNEAAIEQLRTKMSQCKARCYMMIKSTKSCKREVKALMNSIGMSTPVVYLKSNFEYLRANYRKAIKVLNSSPVNGKSTSETGEHLPLMYYNNLGVIHFHMNKHHLGAFYFRKAIAENQFICAEFNKTDPGNSLSGRPIFTLAVSRHYELLYNLGIQLLHCGDPTTGFDCLIQTVQIYQLNPRLWLRLAECCIMANKTSNDEDTKLTERLKVVEGSVGSGIHRKLLLGPGLRPDKNSSDTAAIPVASLEFASLCLRNALTLLPKEPQPSSQSPNDEPADTVRQTAESARAHAPPGNPIQGAEIVKLRCSILASSAYVSLCLCDYLMALHHAETLLQEPKLSGAHRYLGHMYMAEALVAIDRIADAVQHLNPEFISDVGVMFPENKQDLEKERNGDRDPQESPEARGPLSSWSPKDLPTAKALMQYNLATAHAIRGEYEKALNTLNRAIQSLEMLGSPLPAQALYQKLYLELMEGRKDIAQNTVKQYFGHVTPNKS